MKILVALFLASSLMAVSAPADASCKRHVKGGYIPC